MRRPIAGAIRWPSPPQRPQLAEYGPWPEPAGEPKALYVHRASRLEQQSTRGRANLLHHLLKLPQDTLVVTPGTSCRYQVKDFVGIRAKNMAEALLRSWNTPDGKSGIH